MIGLSKHQAEFLVELLDDVLLRQMDYSTSWLNSRRDHSTSRLRDWVKDELAQLKPTIACSETPPPDEGYLRCMYCGEEKPHRLDIRYDEQCDHRSCPTGIGGQAFMGRGWGGWKQPVCTCPFLGDVQVTGSSCPVHGLPDVEWDDL